MVTNQVDHLSGRINSADLGADPAHISLGQGNQCTWRVDQEKSVDSVQNVAARRVSVNHKAAILAESVQFIGPLVRFGNPMLPHEW